MVARTLAVVSQKGGSGKTTTVLNVGASLALATGARVLLVDTDPQATLTDALPTPETRAARAQGRRPPTEASLADVLLDGWDVTRVVRSAHVAGVPTLDVLPAGPDLDRLDRVGNAFDDPRQVRALRAALQPLLAHYDWLILDCPGSLLLGTRMAMLAADELLIPLEARHHHVRSLASMLNTYEQLVQSANRELVVRGLVVTRFERSEATKKQLAMLHAQERVPVLAVIPASAAVASAEMREQPLVCVRPKAPVTLAYHQLALDVLAAPRRVVMPRFQVVDAVAGNG